MSILLQDIVKKVRFTTYQELHDTVNIYLGNLDKDEKIKLEQDQLKIIETFKNQAIFEIACLQRRLININRELFEIQQKELDTENLQINTYKEEEEVENQIEEKILDTINDKNNESEKSSEKEEKANTYHNKNPLQTINLSNSQDFSSPKLNKSSKNNESEKSSEKEEKANSYHDTNPPQTINLSNSQDFSSPKLNKSSKNNESEKSSEKEEKANSYHNKNPPQTVSLSNSQDFSSPKLNKSSKNNELSMTYSNSTRRRRTKSPKKYITQKKASAPKKNSDSSSSSVSLSKREIKHMEKNSDLYYQTISKYDKDTVSYISHEISQKSNSIRRRKRIENVIYKFREEVKNIGNAYPKKKKF